MVQEEAESSSSCSTPLDKAEQNKGLLFSSGLEAEPVGAAVESKWRLMRLAPTGQLHSPQHRPCMLTICGVFCLQATVLTRKGKFDSAVSNTHHLNVSIQQAECAEVFL